VQVQSSLLISILLLPLLDEANLDVEPVSELQSTSDVPANCTDDGRRTIHEQV